MIHVITERFIHTNVLARQSIRQKVKPGRKNALLSVWICMGTSVLVCFFIFLWIRLYILDIGYQISKTLEAKQSLLQENKKLKVERAALSSSARIESIGRKKLAMVTPQSKQIIILKW